MKQHSRGTRSIAVNQLIWGGCLFSLFVFFNSPVFADSVAMSAGVKIANGRLSVLSETGTYAPYFIKGVGYQPTPIGRYPSDWGYSPEDPRFNKTANNIFDDTNILNRDFALLRQMNANTIRIWKGNKTTVSCQCTNNGRFPNYITQNTLDLAAQYGLKVIAGFWMNYLNFDANNHIWITDDSGNVLTEPQIISRFVDYVNTFKTHKAILFWAIGNENNYQMLNSSVVGKADLENVFGTQRGDEIFLWLRETGNFLNYNGDIIVDLNSPAALNALKTQYPADYNSIFNILKKHSGQNLTASQLKAWYSLVNQMACAAHLAEDPAYNPSSANGGKNYHPVAVVNGGIAEIGNSDKGTTDAQMPDLDIWGTNVYTGKSFGTLFDDYAAKSRKPLWISEYGVDAWSVTNASGINNWASTQQKSAGVYDSSTQSDWDVSLWKEVANHSLIAIGANVMEYSDEWWKPYEFYCSNQSDRCNAEQEYFGMPFWGSFPDNFSNEEWFGIMSVNPNSVAGGADVVAPRKVYYDLAAQWSTPDAPTGLSATAGDRQVALSWAASSRATSYFVKYSTVKGGPYTFLTNVTGTAFTQTAGMTNGLTYYFVVSAYNGIQESAISNEASATPTSMQLAAQDAKFISQTVPDSMISGKTYSISITVKNTGRNNWTKVDNFRLGTQNSTDNNIWGLNRVELPKDIIASGETAVLTFNVKAPAQPGTYNFQWKMLQEHVQWFGEITLNKAVNVSVQSAPTNIKAVGGKYKVDLTWDRVDGATSYILYYGTTPGTYSNSIVMGNFMTVNTIQDLKAQTTYYFAISAVTAKGEGPKSAEQSVTTLAGPLDPPVTVIVRPGAASLSLQWNLVSGATSYKFYYGLQPGVYAHSVDLPKDGTATLWLDGGTKYYFAMTAINADGESAKSQEQSATTFLDAPTFLSAVGGPGTATIKWKFAPGSHKCQIYYGIESTHESMSEVDDATEVTLYLQGGKNYQFYLKTADHDGDGVTWPQYVKTLLQTPAVPQLQPVNDELSVQWDAIPNATGYQIYVAATPGQYTKYLSVGAVTSCKLKGLAQNKFYFIALTAFNDLGESQMSSGRSIMIPTPNNSQWTGQTIPDQMTAGQVYAVSVSFKNTGSNIWKKSDNFRLAVQNPTDNNFWGLSRVELSKDVNPGETAQFNFNVTAPAKPGNYNFQWKMMQEGIQWFGETTPNKVITVIPVPKPNDSKYITQTAPDNMIAGGNYQVSVTLQNTGSNTWKKADAFRLSTQNWPGNNIWGLTRVEMPKDVAPNETVVLTFSVTAPAKPGNYNLQWKMMQEGVQWFGETTPNKVITVK
ncbi:MAG: hypothetical protein HQL23_03540 [Candidatus Omnitrophica bacterium]|nr:hypothetical protein [Candidatus Omnitrophota bacterium]